MTNNTNAIDNDDFIISTNNHKINTIHTMITNVIPSTGNKKLQKLKLNASIFHVLSYVCDMNEQMWNTYNHDHKANLQSTFHTIKQNPPYVMNEKKHKRICKISAIKRGEKKTR